MEQSETRQESAPDFKEIAERIASTDVTVYERLNASNDKAAKAEFVENPELIHPNNEYGNLDRTEVESNLDELAALEEAIQDESISDKRRRLLMVLIEDNRRKNAFLEANLDYNAATTPDEKAAAAERHRQANRELYGEPDEDTFYALLAEQISSIDVDSLSEEDRKVYDELLAKIGPIKPTTRERFTPKPETIKRFAELVEYYFESFLKHIPEEQESFSSEDMVRIINEILDEELGGEEAGYRAIVDSAASNASVDQEKRLIKFPEGKTYTRERARGLIVHELGTHALRAVPYLDHDVQAFSTGMPDNETFDEGIAKCVEQAINGQYVEAGIDHYINIGLATFKGKNFREIYDIQMMLKRLTGKSNSTVLNAVQRCFRGTGELPNNKDLAYYNGAAEVWQYIEQHIDDPDLFDNLFLVGKSNTLDSDQASLAYENRTGAGL